MKVKLCTVLILACAVWFGCKQNETPCSALPLAPPLPSDIRVRIVDKTTGADLFLTPTSPYKFSDLVVTSSLMVGQDHNVQVDSVEKDNRFISIAGDESQTFILKLASLPADTIRISVGVTASRCYQSTNLNSVTLNKTSLCSPCSFAQVFTIKK